MVVQFVEKKLQQKSEQHRQALVRLGEVAQEKPLSDRVLFLEQTTQLQGMNTILHDIKTTSEDFIFDFDRLAALLAELYGSP